MCRRVLVCVHLCMDYFGSSLPRQLLATGGGNTRHQQALIKLTSALKSTHSKAVSHIFKINTTPSTKKMTKNTTRSVHFTTSPPLVHLCVSSVVLSRTPAVAAERRQRTVAVPQEAGALRHLRHSVFGLFFSFSASASTTAAATVQSCSDSSPNLDALHWAPDAFQALAALEAGAGWTDAGCVVRGGTGDRDLAGAVSSGYWFIVLQTRMYIHSMLLFHTLTAQHNEPKNM